MPRRAENWWRQQVRRDYAAMGKKGRDVLDAVVDDLRDLSVVLPRALFGVFVVLPALIVWPVALAWWVNPLRLQAARLRLYWLFRAELRAIRSGVHDGTHDLYWYDLDFVIQHLDERLKRYPGDRRFMIVRRAAVGRRRALVRRAAARRKEVGL